MGQSTEKFNDAYAVQEIKLIYQLDKSVCNRPVINRSNHAYDIFLKTWDKDLIGFVEHFKILLLNTKLKVLGIYEVARGCCGKIRIEPKLIFAAAIKANANSIILGHNHPSGSLEPSESDKCFTKRMVEAGRLLDIKIYDHLIITEDGFFSFADEGAL